MFGSDAEHDIKRMTEREPQVALDVAVPNSINIEGAVLPQNRRRTGNGIEKGSCGQHNHVAKSDAALCRSFWFGYLLH